jgi:hypothetical protein
VSTPRLPRRRLLLAYPPEWRARYGAEYLAFLEDQEAERPLRPTGVAGIVVAGLRERFEASVPAPATCASPERSGALLVLWSWCALTVAGIALAKEAEHFSAAVPAGSRAGAVGAYDALVALAVLGGLAVLAGVAVAVPAAGRMLGHGGWASIRPRVIAATVATVATVGVGAAVVARAHDLTTAQRNGLDVRYAGAATVLAGLFVLTLVLWTGTAVAVGRRLELPVTAGRVLTAAAAVAAGCVVGVAACAAVWWAIVARSAPDFLGGSAAPPQLVAAGACLVVALTAAMVGMARLVRPRSPA